MPPAPPGSHQAFLHAGARKSQEEPGKSGEPGGAPGSSWVPLGLPSGRSQEEPGQPCESVEPGCPPGSCLVPQLVYRSSGPRSP